ncbi:MAG: RDD family protein [Bacteriovoracaceae bacterium]|nr:RDD family protein [Bacteriovoracaceae bacterium]
MEKQIHKKSEKVSNLLRTLAFITDLVTLIGLSLTTISLISFVFPPESFNSFLLVFSALPLTFLFYYVFLPSYFGNLPGKYLVGIKVSSFDKKEVSILRYFLRMLLIGFWPLNGLFIILGKSKRHLGDFIASTMVIKQKNVRMIKVLPMCIFLCFLTLYLGNFSLKLSVIKTDSFQAAKSYLSEEHKGSSIAFIPYSFIYNGVVGNYDIKVDNNYYLVQTYKNNQGEWTVGKSVINPNPSGSKTLTVAPPAFLIKYMMNFMLKK